MNKNKNRGDFHSGDTQRKNIAKLEAQIKSQEQQISSLGENIDTRNNAGALPPPPNKNFRWGLLKEEVKHSNN